MILIISMTIHNHVDMVANHMIQDRTDRNLMAMMDINQVDTDKIRNGYDFLRVECLVKFLHQYLRL